MAATGPEEVKERSCDQGNTRVAKTVCPLQGPWGFTRFQMQVSLLVSSPSLKNSHRCLELPGDIEAAARPSLAAGRLWVLPPTLPPRPAPT